MKVITLILALVLLYGNPIYASIFPLTDDELVQESRTIFVGFVINKECLLNHQGNLIVTDYTFRVTEVLKGRCDEYITLQFAGGTLNGETHKLTGIPEFMVDSDSRVLVMIEESRHPLLSPITGTSQGIFFETIQSGFSNPITTDYYSNPIGDRDGIPISFEMLISKVKHQIKQVKNLKPVKREISPDSVKYILTNLPSKIYDASDTSVSSLGGTALPALSDVVGWNANLLMHRSATNKKRGVDIPIEHFEDTAIKEWAYSNLPYNVPIVFEPLPPGGSVSGCDQLQIIYWNEYASIFHIYVIPNGTWAYGNNVFEIAGFVSDSTLVAQFGMGWNMNSLSTSLKKIDHNGWTTEADICLNSAMSWTQHDFLAYFNPNLHSVPAAYTYELGFSLGLDNEYESLSIMNAVPKKYKTYNTIYLDDVLGLRSAFPTHTTLVKDLNLKPFRNNGYQNYLDATLSSTSIMPGETITASGFTIENLGTTTLSPVIGWYLVPVHGSWSAKLYLQSSSHGVLNSETSIVTSQPVVIPSTIPLGKYYLAAELLDKTDMVTRNNSCWFEQQVEVEPNFVSLAEFSRSFFELYPNPTKGITSVHLTKDGKAQLVLYDFSGRLLQSFEFDNETPLDLSGYAKGVYLIKVQIDDNTFTQKVMKK